MADDRPKDYGLDSPNGAYRARVEFGPETPSVLSSGYGKPYYPTTVTVTAVAEASKKLVVWREDAERTQVTFSALPAFVWVADRPGCRSSPVGAWPRRKRRGPDPQVDQL